MKIGVISLGCCKNLVDTQMALSFLQASGHQFVSEPAQADTIVINTCGFINSAKEEAINTILEMAEYKKDKLKFLVVMGCLVQRYRKDLERDLPEVDLFISIEEYPHMADIFNNFFHTKLMKQPEVLLATPNYWTYLRIADGCNNKCAYCAIPLIRKDYKSVEFEELLKQAAKLESIGVKELNLIAQDTTRYGKDLYDKYRLAELLTELDKMNFEWIRILYMYPDEITDELLNTMSKCKKVIPYFDIPIQHSSDRLLKLMNRRGLQKDIREVIRKIREKFTNPIIRTTIIVGFPSETAEEFDELMNFVDEIKFGHLGGFTYSLEEDTPSYDMEPKVPQEISEQRLEKLMKKQATISLSNNQKFIGQTVKVLVEDFQDYLYQCRGVGNAPDDIDGHIYVTSEYELYPGDMVDVVISSVDEYDLYGNTLNN